MSTKTMTRATTDHARKGASQSDAKASEPQTFGDYLDTLSTGTGPISADLLSVVVPLALGAVHDASADRTVEAEAQVAAAQDALRVAREAAKDVLKVQRAAKVDVSRFLLIVTTPVVRGDKSMDAQDAAAALGVSKAYVSQMVANAKALHTLGTWTPEAYTTVDAARRKGAKVLAATVKGAQDAARVAAQVKADERAKDGKSHASVPVRVTGSMVKDAAVQAGAVAKTERPADLSALADAMSKTVDALEAGRPIVGDASTVARIVALAAQIAKVSGL